MTKRYLDELAEWLRSREASRARPDQSRVAFLAVRGEVQAAMAAGYALKTIWAHLRETGRIACRYETFLNYVRRHIKEPPPAADEGRAEKSDPGAPKPAAPQGMEGFTFDATPKKEELI
ncbi:MAG: TraK family protein [Gammaproteobacteria bacterium]